MALSIEEPLKAEERAYLAGLIDARGSICMKLRRKTEWYVRLKLFCLSEPQMVWIRGLFPKKKGPECEPPQYGGDFVLENRHALRVLAACFYFLKTARQKARLALEFGQTRKGSGSGKITPEELKAQAKIAAQLSELNRARK